MARLDIEISIQQAPTEYGLIVASATFDEGDALAVGAAGALDEAGDDPSSILGIAAQRSTDFDGASVASGTPITFYPARPDNIFSTTNFATDGAGTLTAPPSTAIGDTAGLSRTGGVWSLDTGTDNHIAVVTGVLNLKGESILDPHTVNTTGVTVLFRFN